ncbi:hypothetical protein JCM6882_005987 [Rhodosporidiobolus microsporus]
MKITLSTVLGFIAVSSLVAGAPVANVQQAALDKRAARINEIRALREEVDAAALVAKRSPQGNRGEGSGRGRGNTTTPASPNGNGRGHRRGKGRGHDRHDDPRDGEDDEDCPDDDNDEDNDPQNCGGRFIVCPASYNGVGEPICDFGRCRLRCPPGLREFFADRPELPSFCAE